MHRNTIVCLLISVTIYLFNFPVYGANNKDNESTDNNPEYTAEAPKENSFKADCRNQSALKNFGNIIYKTPENFLNQFIYTDSLLYIFATAGSMFVLNRYDAGIQEKIEEKQYLGKQVHQAGDIAGIATNIPVFQFGIYFYALKKCDKKMLNFSTEVLAAHLLVNLETLVISNIPYHSRPNAESGENPSFFERAFRGKSSFPSGHVAGVSVLMFKGWEYYGYLAGIPPLVLTIYIGWARMESGDHFLSDIVGTVALAGIASLATSRTYSSFFCPLDNLFFYPYFTGSNFGLFVRYKL